MAARDNEVYTRSNGGTIGQNQVTGLVIEFKGTTMDGFNIHHFVFYRNGIRMSYDTVRMNGGYYYILGSGHEVDRNEQIVRWDPSITNRVTWQEALTKYSTQLV